jgi:uncharacterized membrane protein
MKNKSSFILIILLLCLGAIGLNACSKSPEGCSSSVDCASITYSATIQPLVATKCAISGCHAGSYGTYAGLKTIADNGNLYDQVIGSNNMPTGGVDMSCEQRAQIECWINAGAPNN